MLRRGGRHWRRQRARQPGLETLGEPPFVAGPEAPVVLEGAWPCDKIVVIAFPTEAEARRFQTDPGYAAISSDRNAGADTIALMVQGL